MVSARPESSLWGNIITCTEIALHVYEIVAEYKSGIVIPTEQAEELLSPKAIALGNEKDGYLHYEDEKSMIPAYELLQKDLITAPDIKEQYGTPEQLEKEGPFFVPEYFGTLEEPQTSPWGDIAKTTTIHHGIGLIESEGKAALAVHQTIGDLFLSDMARQHAVTDGGYLFYTLDANCAIPIYELSASHPQVLELIIDEDSLVHTLCEDFPDYVDFHNRHVDEWGWIQDFPAPKGLFLQAQVDQEIGHPLRTSEQVAESSLSYGSEPETNDFFEPNGEYEL
ncbi:hypothetical protein KM924_01295 [Brevibacillus parabrevis]|uniref:hypothetical protein n=1 Tax=Brevibacillus parabrevis TaxID=54914 RepID=UPI001C212C97|nr:hypothetical protein [Brevibacillus parabrevis]MBU8711126.1 hypothetical protein [Brevibacillus parabrevis]